jgi:tetratricopeptide (TPR) repeat protein
MITPANGRRYAADPNYFRLTYQLAALQLNAALSADSIRVNGQLLTREELVKRSAATALNLVEDAERLLTRYRKKTAQRSWKRGFRKGQLDPREERLHRFLIETVKPSAWLVRAGALLAQDKTSEAERVVGDIREEAKRNPLSYRTYYNLACYDASRESRTDAIEDLRQAVRRASGRNLVELLRWAKDDPSLKSLQRNADTNDLLNELLEQYAPSVVRKEGTRLHA